MLHRNKGAPFRREDGSVWGRGKDAEPTRDELRRYRYKLRPVQAAQRISPVDLTKIKPPFYGIPLCGVPFLGGNV